MKTALKIIIAIALVAALGAGIYAFAFIQSGINYDVDTVESIGTSVEIVSEDVDSVTIKKTDGGDFKVVMFSDTHLNGSKDTDIMCVEYIIENITREKPDLVIFGGDNISSALSYKRTTEFCQLMENLGVYWAAVFGNHDGEGVLTYTKKQLAEIYSSYDHCLLKPGVENIDGYGNYTVNILNEDDSIKEVFFFMDSGEYSTEKEKAQYEATSDSTYDGVKESQVQWYKDKHDALTEEFGEFQSVTVIHIPPYQSGLTEEMDFIYGSRNENVCEAGYDSGLFDALKEKNTCQAVYYGHDHVNDYGVMYKGILLSYIQSSGYSSYNMGSRDLPESEWLQGCTILSIREDGTFEAHRHLNHAA
ncbi:MAG: metallophosphoesterase [Clostridia bacterium]|nr:metallophosphoesterase [Clostridia bacterium]